MQNRPHERRPAQGWSGIVQKHGGSADPASATIGASAATVCSAWHADLESDPSWPKLPGIVLGSLRK
jgi:hypothetical protein